ncbi:MAG: DUF362 domain-containing protein [bacterium]|nr:DUF362 domain-containing protein [bacterium]
MASKVSIVRCSDYDKERVFCAVREGLDLIGGLIGYIKPGDKVFLKPNLLRASSPEEGVTTHPAVVEAVARLVNQAGGQVIIGDSPALPYTKACLKKVYAKCGLIEVAKETGAKLNYDTSSINLSYPEGDLMKMLTLIKVVLDVDTIINLPKLKTHVSAVFTGACKNLFGLVPGCTKAGYHGMLKNIENLSRMWIDIFTFLKQKLNILNIMDGIVGLEGDWKQGSQRKIGVILSSTDSLALDFVACKLVGILPMSTPILRTAVKRRLISGRLEDIEIVGASLYEVFISDFKPATGIATMEGFNRENLTFFQNLMRPFFKRLLTLRPMPNPNACLGCGNCRDVCPQDAITIVKGKAKIDEKACIHCYCCYEVCPEKAIDLKQPWLGRIVSG